MPQSTRLPFEQQREVSKTLFELEHEAVGSQHFVRDPATRTRHEGGRPEEFGPGLEFDVTGRLYRLAPLETRVVEVKHGDLIDSLRNTRLSSEAMSLLLTELHNSDVIGHDNRFPPHFPITVYMLSQADFKRLRRDLTVGVSEGAFYLLPDADYWIHKVDQASKSLWKVVYHSQWRQHED